MSRKDGATAGAGRSPARQHPALSRQVLEPLYVDEGLSLSQIAQRVGPPATKRTVQRALQAYGVPLRPARPPARKQALMSRELLERLYVDECRNLPEVAAIVGVNPATVIARMRALGIPRRKGAWHTPGGRQPMTRDLLLELRVNQRMSAVKIAELLGYSEIQVRSALRRHGITAPGQKHFTGRLGGGELWWLHHHEGLSLREIAARLRTNVTELKARMEHLGIDIRKARHRGPPPARPSSVPPPDLELLSSVLEDAAAKPPGPARRSIIDEASDDELRRLHLEQGKGLTEIGRLYECTARRVRGRLEAAGIEVRHRRGRRGTGSLTNEDRERLDRLYGRPEVLETLSRLNVPLRVDEETPDPPVDLTEHIVRTLYEEVGLTPADIGLLTARSHSSVSRALRHYGIEIKRRIPEPEPVGPGRRVELTRDSMTEMVKAGNDADSIARLLGIATPTTVRIAAQVLEVALPGEARGSVPLEVLDEVRGNGISAGHAAAVLDPRHLGVGAGKGLPAWPWPPGPRILNYLYHDLHIGLAEIADRLRCDYDDLKAAFGSYGIALLSPHDTKPSRRWKLDPAELKSLYVDEGRRVEDIANRIGVSEALIYRALHRHHLPVAADGGRGEPRVRYEELLADPRVTEALADSSVELAGADPPTRRRPLPAALLARLIGQLGLSSFDLELLTGRSARGVREDCEAAGIERPSLPPGVTVERLRDLYEVKKLSQGKICEELGLRSESTLRTALRRAGIPRRSFRANPWNTRRRL